MLIIGIDPGTTRIGVGIIKKERSLYKALDYKLLVPEKTLLTLPLGEKLSLIYSTFTLLLEEIKPTVVGLESLIFAKNVKTAFPVAYARAMMILACSQKNIPLFEPTPLQVKQGVSSQGNADKKQVAFMVKTILHIPKETKILDDITDALAVAITTANFTNNWGKGNIIP